MVIMNDNNLVDLRICQYRNSFFVDYDCNAMNSWSDVDRWMPLEFTNDVNDKFYQRLRSGLSKINKSYDRKE